MYVKGVNVLLCSSLGPGRADCVLAVVFLLLSYRCIVTISVLWLFLMAPWVGLQSGVVAFPDNTHILLMAVNVW